MRGPEILARTMTVPAERGASNAQWQYHSRSDRHSKVACWTMLFDLLLECDAIRARAEEGRVGFGINFVMVGPINKTLDLVLTVTPPARPRARRRKFADLVDVYEIVLDKSDRAKLKALPLVEEDHRDDVSEVSIAMEAKACMTEHVKSLPRLHAEILATGYLAKRAAPHCISVSYSLVNAAPTFKTPSGSGRHTNVHNQPDDARRVVKMLSEALPLAADSKQIGFDAIGVTVINCRNDGSPVILEKAAPAPSTSDHVHYDRMIRSVCSAFRSRF